MTTSRTSAATRWLRTIGLGLLLLSPSAVAGQGVPAHWDVYAVRYGALPSFRVSGLIAGADTSRRIDATLMVWLLRGPNGRVVLVDAGFKRPDLIARWKPIDYMRPDSALARAGAKAEDITDVIISHIHWDHFDGADLFPRAKIWIQLDEVNHHVDANGTVLDRAIDGPDAAMLTSLRAAGRVALVNGDDQEIIPGIRVYTGGKHTWQSQYVGVQTRSGTVVLASDNLYLYENLDKRVPIAQTVDPIKNLLAQDRMKELAATPTLIVPGHDPAVFERFEKVAPGVVRIR
jgi:glyoxylase-like metal-dependent hydrolase (beta-lactamase superfamily II)